MKPFKSKKYILAILLCIFCSNIIFSQQKVTISGYVTDEATGGRLSGATVHVPGLNLGTTCNDYGF